MSLLFLLLNFCDIGLVFILFIKTLTVFQIFVSDQMVGELVVRRYVFS